MKPTDVELSTYIDLGFENNDENPKFKAGEQMRILWYKNIFEIIGMLYEKTKNQKSNRV